MAYSDTSPNADNYFIGKGYVEFQAEGDTDFVHLGNCPEVEFSPTVDVLDHFSSMAGVRTKDRKVVREKSATLRIVMEELTPYNLGLALMGEVTGAVAPATTQTIDIFSLSEIKGAMRFVGQNDIGARVQYDWPVVSITPTSSINLISEEWGTMEITADVLADPSTGRFGTVQWGITDEVDAATAAAGRERTRSRMPARERAVAP
jgi:hypothetical protein